MNFISPPQSINQDRLTAFRQANGPLDLHVTLPTDSHRPNLGAARRIAAYGSAVLGTATLAVLAALKFRQYKPLPAAVSRLLTPRFVRTLLVANAATNTGISWLDTQVTRNNTGNGAVAGLVSDAALFGLSYAPLIAKHALKALNINLDANADGRLATATSVISLLGHSLGALRPIARLGLVSNTPPPTFSSSSSLRGIGQS